MSSSNAAEARRQIEICNACRYCEGFCAVFPAMTRQRTFSLQDITQLANLCHNCQGCFHACQYTAPHEFEINLPGILAEVRTESWERLSAPSWLAHHVHRNGVVTAALLVAAFTLFAAWAMGLSGGATFYDYFSHNQLVAIFTPLFLLPGLAIVFSIRRYWLEVKGEPVKLNHLTSALRSVASLKNLSGGQGQGCQYEDGDRYSHKRRWAHQAVMYGFILCFASTSTATVMHYLLDQPAPYGLFSVPKLLGIPGGLLLSVGCLALMALKWRAEPHLGSASRWGGDWAFIGLLFLTASSGLALYLATGSVLMPGVLCFHLACVAALFFLAPYSKMVHGFFRLAALVRDAQTVRQN